MNVYPSAVILKDESKHCFAIDEQKKEYAVIMELVTMPVKKTGYPKKIFN